MQKPKYLGGCLNTPLCTSMTMFYGGKAIPIIRDSIETRKLLTITYDIDVYYYNNFLDIINVIIRSFLIQIENCHPFSKL